VVECKEKTVSPVAAFRGLAAMAHYRVIIPAFDTDAATPTSLAFA
jgi:hypothetical protein